jgi:hypothetical protein
MNGPAALSPAATQEPARDAGLLEARRCAPGHAMAEGLQSVGQDERCDLSAPTVKGSRTAGATGVTASQANNGRDRSHEAKT